MNVDVILPTYNGEKFVAAAIHSVVAQTHHDWHLTVIDDGSTDQTIAEVEAIAREFPGKLTLLRNRENLRAAASRMKAIGGTDSPLLAFLDQDDCWHPEKLARQVALLTADSMICAVHGDVEHMDSMGRSLPGSADAENARRAALWSQMRGTLSTCRSLFRRNTIRLVSMMVRRSCFTEVGGFRTDLFGGEEWEFWVRLSSTHAIVHTPEVLMQRRIHAHNTSTAMALARTHGLLEALAIAVSEHPELADLHAARLRELRTRLVVEYSQARQYGQALTVARSVAGVRPFTLSSLAVLFVGLSGPIGRYLVAARRNWLSAR